MLTHTRPRRVFAALLALVSSASAATFHVATTGNDANPGTEISPVRRVQWALSLAQPGDSIRLSPGVYAEDVLTVRNGTADAPITLDGQNSAVIHRLSINRAYHKIQNLTISGYTVVPRNILFLQRGAHSTIVSNVVVDTARVGRLNGIGWEISATKPFGTDAASGCLIISNRITGVLSATGLNIAGDNNQIVGNYVHDLGQSDFVRLWGRTNIIRGNVFSNMFSVAGLGNHIDFIQTFGNGGDGSWGHIIEGNLIFRIDGGQIAQLEGNLVPEIGNWIIRNNVFAEISHGTSCTIPQVRLYNNIFYRCNYGVGSHALNFTQRAYTTATWAGQPVPGTNYAHGAQVYNNVFLDCGDSRRSVGWYGFSTMLTGVSADHNYVGKIGFQSVTASTRSDSAVGESNYDGLFSEYNGVNGGDPKFRSPKDFDFRTKVESVLINAGTTNPFSTVDLLGNPRRVGSATDIGVFEFSSNGPLAPSGLRVVP